MRPFRILLSLPAHAILISGMLGAFFMAGYHPPQLQPTTTPPIAENSTREPTPAEIFQSLPEHDFLSEAKLLLLQEEFDQARAICRFQVLYGTQNAEERRQFMQLIEEADRLETSMSRRSTQVARGVLTGEADSLPALAGAVVSDFFVFGDLRDITIQGYRWGTGKEVNKAVLVLSTLGLATTVVPGADWVPSLFKRAIRAGRVAPSYVETVAKRFTKASRAERKALAGGMLEDASTISQSWGKGGFYHALKHLDHADDLAHLAKYSGKYGDAGAIALRLGGDDITGVLRAGTDLGKRADLAKAAGKGPRGIKMYLRHGTKIFQPHIAIGAAKTIARPERVQFARRTLKAKLLNNYLARVPSAAWIGIASVFALLELAYLKRRFLFSR